MLCLLLICEVVNVGFGVLDMLLFWFGEFDCVMLDFICDVVVVVLCDGMIFYMYNFGMVLLCDVIVIYVGVCYGVMLVDMVVVMSLGVSVLMLVV